MNTPNGSRTLPVTDLRRYRNQLAALYARKGDVSRLTCALDNGVDVNAMDELGCSLITNAAQRGRVRAIELLLMRGANVNMIDRAGRTPLGAAAFGAHVSAVAVLLERGADALVSTDQGTAREIAEQRRAYFHFGDGGLFDEYANRFARIVAMLEAHLLGGSRISHGPLDDGLGI